MPEEAAGPTVPLTPGVDAVPVLHGRMEFAACVHQALTELRPDVVALELPATLERLHRRAVTFLPALTVIVTRWDDGRPALHFVTPQAALAEAARRAGELGIPVHYVDQDVDGYPDHLESFPDPAVIPRLGLARYYRLVAGASRREPLDEVREATMAHHLHRLRAEHGRVLFVGGLHHLEGLRRRLEGAAPPRPLARVRVRQGAVYEVSPRTVERLLCLGEAPYLIAAYEHCRNGAGRFPPARGEVQRLLLAAARPRYEGETGEEVTPHQLRVLAQFARNLARLTGQLTPDTIQLLAAARGAVDENFGHAVLELATHYPFRAPAGKLPVREVTHEELDWMRTRFLRVHPRIQQVRPRPWDPGLRRRRRERRPGDWRRKWESGKLTQCSYPPEDLVIEGYGRSLKERARTVLTESRRRVEPFSTSFLDGLDVRETLRRWHEGRVWVKNSQPVHGEVGSVVVILDEDEDRYPWEMTWWGEHEQESDMAFYATDPDRQVVGPGIARAEYGGYLMSYPPGRLYDVWKDPYYRAAESRAERLLMAGIEYSEARFVAYVAARPPRSRFLTMAERFGRQLVYVPLGTLSPQQVKRIRVFHVLRDQRVREHAREYIW